MILPFGQIHGASKRVPRKWWINFTVFAVSFLMARLEEGRAVLCNFQWNRPNLLTVIFWNKWANNWRAPPPWKLPFLKCLEWLVSSPQRKKVQVLFFNRTRVCNRAYLSIIMPWTAQDKSSVNKLLLKCWYFSRHIQSEKRKSIPLKTSTHTFPCLGITTGV